ncbi:hypothetical protein [Streptomyces capoamus]|uniref:hypothetical protein n=1 Tax=Streptomyces capoamus TaxID=68183 RepID=UPI0033931851
MPDDVLHLMGAALTAHPRDDAVATAIGVHLPALHHHAPAFTAEHAALYALDPHRPSLAAAWLRWGGLDADLLTAVGRDQSSPPCARNCPAATRKWHTPC